MMRNNTHQVADFDSIVGDETSRQILASEDLLPSEWKLPDREADRILALGVKIKVVQKVRGAWPACYVGADYQIDIAADFLKSCEILRQEKIATMLHEVGHAVDAIRSQIVEKQDAEKGENPYLKAMGRRYGDDRKAMALDEEFFADDYARHCGFEKALHSVLLKLDKIMPERIARIENGMPLNTAFDS